MAKKKNETSVTNTSDTLVEKYTYNGEGDLLSDTSETNVTMDSIIEDVSEETDDTEDENISNVVSIIEEDVVTEEIITEEIATEETTTEETVIEEIITEEPIIVSENTKPFVIKGYRETFGNLMNMNKSYILSFKGSVVFDSDKDHADMLKLHDDFIEYKRTKINYIGLSLKFKK